MHSCSKQPFAHLRCDGGDRGALLSILKVAEKVAQNAKTLKVESRDALIVRLFRCLLRNRHQHDAKQGRVFCSA